MFHLEEKELLNLHNLQSTRRLSKLFIKMPDERLRNGSKKLKQGRFWPDLGEEKSMMMKVIKLREVVLSPSLEIFKTSIAQSLE